MLLLPALLTLTKPVGDSSISTGNSSWALKANSVVFSQDKWGTACQESFAGDHLVISQQRCTVWRRCIPPIYSPEEDFSSPDNPAPGELQICRCSHTVLSGAGSRLLLGLTCLSLFLCECSSHLLRTCGLWHEFLSILPWAWAAEVLSISCKGSHTPSALGLVLALASLCSAVQAQSSGMWL